VNDVVEGPPGPVAVTVKGGDPRVELDPHV
jgi:hypothetical protein